MKSMKGAHPQQQQQRNPHPEDSQIQEIPTGNLLQLPLTFLSSIDDLDRIKTSDISKYNYDLHHSLMMEIFTPNKSNPIPKETNETLKKLHECKTELQSQISKLHQQIEELSSRGDMEN